MAVFAGCELAWERMSRENGGRGGLIVNTASLAGLGKGFNRVFSSYSAAKHGVVALTRTMGVGTRTMGVATFVASHKHIISRVLSMSQETRHKLTHHGKPGK